MKNFDKENHCLAIDLIAKATEMAASAMRAEDAARDRGQPRHKHRGIDDLAEHLNRMVEVAAICKCDDCDVPLVTHGAECDPGKLAEQEGD